MKSHRIAAQPRGTLQQETLLMRFLSLTAALLCAGALTAAEKPAEAKKRLLVITQSAGFVHGVVKRPNENELSLAEKTLIEIGNKNNIEVVCSQNAREMITAENLAKFDALFFYTT